MNTYAAQLLRVTAETGEHPLRRLRVGSLKLENLLEWINNVGHEILNLVVRTGSKLQREFGTVEASRSRGEEGSAGWKTERLKREGAAALRKE
jgi:hypothetical protein